MRSVSGAPKRSVVRSAPTLASARGTPKKINYLRIRTDIMNFVHLSQSF
ncbi:MAG: hypothetical protein NZ519_01110 [Bacteroidia bacterium]|nr:hypothetical protein [Bacteroidia bacterium]